MSSLVSLVEPCIAVIEKEEKMREEMRINSTIISTMDGQTVAPSARYKEQSFGHPLCPRIVWCGVKNCVSQFDNDYTSGNLIGALHYRKCSKHIKEQAKFT